MGKADFFAGLIGGGTKGFFAGRKLKEREAELKLRKQQQAAQAERIKTLDEIRKNQIELRRNESINRSVIDAARISLNPITGQLDQKRFEKLATSLGVPSDRIKNFTNVLGEAKQPKQPQEAPPVPSFDKQSLTAPAVAPEREIPKGLPQELQNQLEQKKIEERNALLEQGSPVGNFIPDPTPGQVGQFERQQIREGSPSLIAPERLEMREQQVLQEEESPLGSLLKLLQFRQ